MKVVRTITYEGTPEQIRKQLTHHSRWRAAVGSMVERECQTCGRIPGTLKDGTYDYMTKITVRTVRIDKDNGHMWYPSNTRKLKERK